MPKQPPRAMQLTLDFDGADPSVITPVRALSPQQFLHALRQRRARGVEGIRFKENRARIIALSKDGRTLHIHTCFREADDVTLDAISVFLKAGRRSLAYRDAIRQIRDFWTDKGQSGGWAAEEDESIIEGVRRLPSSGTREQSAFVREAYARFNQLHFDGRLPDVPLRISDRMASRFGHMRYHIMVTGERIVLEIAINHSLFARGHEHNLLDTLLHEMTHVEAWLTHGHRGHGAVWKRIARSVGCEPRACSAKIIRRRRRGSSPLDRVPDFSLLPAVSAQGGLAAYRQLGGRVRG